MAPVLTKEFSSCYIKLRRKQVFRPKNGTSQNQIVQCTRNKGRNLIYFNNTNSKIKSTE